MRLMSGDLKHIESITDAQINKRADYRTLIEAIDSDIFSYSLRDFLSQCLVIEHDKRASAHVLLGHIWIREMEAERLQQLELISSVRIDFTTRFKNNFSRLKTTTRQEWALFKMLEQYDLLETEYAEL